MSNVQICFLKFGNALTLPRSLGALNYRSHDRFQEWRSAGVFKRMWIDGLSAYDKKTGIDWKWQAMDGVIKRHFLVPRSLVRITRRLRLYDSYPLKRRIQSKL